MMPALLGLKFPEFVHDSMVLFSINSSLCATVCGFLHLLRVEYKTQGAHLDVTDVTLRSAPAAEMINQRQRELFTTSPAR